MLANLFGIEVCYYSYAPGESSRHNHKPQLYPQHRNHHDEVWKNVIPYALGLTRSIAYLRNCLVNRKTAIIVKMTLHVGIRKKYKYRSYTRYQILTIPLAVCSYDWVFYGSMSCKGKTRARPLPWLGHTWLPQPLECIRLPRPSVFTGLPW